VSHAPIPTEPLFNPEDPDVPVPVKQPGDQPTWFQRPENVKKVIVGLYVVAALAVLLDFTYTKHSHFPIENIFGFYGFYGFVGCVTLVLLAKLLRKVVMRAEDYYDTDASGASASDAEDSDAE
jgi:uncharacterized membrane protein